MRTVCVRTSGACSSARPGRHQTPTPKSTDALWPAPSADQNAGPWPSPGGWATRTVSSCSYASSSASAPVRTSSGSAGCAYATASAADSSPCSSSAVFAQAVMT